ncbi:MAG: amino acid aminotransferase [Myxococcota bacterium]|nr:amino acid aminotransferase [Myxococcota bacterium]
MFESLEPMPPDAILGLMEAFRADPREHKIDLGVGVYQDERGETPVLACVKQAEERLLAEESSKSYVGPAGAEGYNARVQALLFGDALATRIEERTSVVQTPGGCGALRVAAELVLRCRRDAVVHVPDPTWANHVPLLGDAGLEIRAYPYFDRTTSGLRFDAMAAHLDALGPGDLVLLHGCCHNPCGADLDRAQWQAVLELAQRRGFTPLVDLAYQGFGDGLDEDAFGVRLLAAELPELIVATSCSKNFGLYRERTGAIALISESAPTARIARSQLLNVIRGIYSMPPSHGGAIVDRILGDEALRGEWLRELGTMRDRIHALRSLLALRFADHGDAGRFSFLGRQRGMFSLLGIGPAQVKALRDEHAIYLVDSSRINVAGASHDNVDRLCGAVMSVLSAAAGRLGTAEG